MLFWLICIFYFGWLILTCLNQPGFVSNEWLLKFDRFHLVPSWSFFAPNPGISDYNLLMRNKLADGTVTAFSEIPLRGKKNVATALFNPGRRLQKVLHDHARTLIKLIETDVTEENKENIKLTFSYISILNYCADRPAMPGSEYVQFVILESFGYNELTETRLIINSEFHKL
jgi:hypothetical protein